MCLQKKKAIAAATRTPASVAPTAVPAMAPAESPEPDTCESIVVVAAVGAALVDELDSDDVFVVVVVVVRIRVTLK